MTDKDGFCWFAAIDLEAKYGPKHPVEIQIRHPDIGSSCDCGYVAAAFLRTGKCDEVHRSDSGAKAKLGLSLGD